jgi:hypothetical protein
LVFVPNYSQRAHCPRVRQIKCSPSYYCFGRLGRSGGQQVGAGEIDVDGRATHALLWTGSAESVSDLNAFLPTGFTDAFATGIDAEGNIVGAAGGPATGVNHVFLWKPAVVPEPSTIVLFGIGLCGIVIAGGGNSVGGELPFGRRTLPELPLSRCSRQPNIIKCVGAGRHHVTGCGLTGSGCACKMITSSHITSA